VIGTTLVFVAALSLAPGQAGSLSLANPHTTYGIGGLPRGDTKFLPGDSVALAFEIQGIKPDSSGKVLYSIGMEVTDSGGKSVFKQAPRDLEAPASLGGNSVPGFATVQIGLDQPPGMYTLKVTVTDRTTKAAQSLTRACEVLPKGFGLVRFHTSRDPEGRYLAALFAEGETLWVNFSAVGFARGPQGQPDVTVSLRVLDESGKPTAAKASTGEVAKDVSANAPAIPMQFWLDLNRSGKFTVEVKATDKVSGKNAALSFPLLVQKPK
jgi:hypothetical protein